MLMNTQKKTLVIGITGKRKLSAEQIKAVTPLVDQAIKNIISAETADTQIPPEVIGITPLAEGADTLFANRMIALGYRLKSFLPFEKAEYLKDFTASAYRDEFEKLYKAIPQDYKSEIGSLKEADRNELYLRVGQRIAGESDYMIAIWDEKPANGKGGTADVVKYAMQLYENDPVIRRRVLIINPDEAVPKIKVSHIFCEGGSMGQHTLPAILSTCIDKHEAKSKHHKHNYQQTWNVSFWLGLIAATLFAIKISAPKILKHPEDLQRVCSIAEFLIILGILLLIRFKKPGLSHGRHLYHRFVAERLRILETHYEARLPAPPLRSNPTYEAFQKTHIIDSSKDWSMSDVRTGRQLVNLAYDPQLPVEERKIAVLKLVQGQINYHADRLARENYHLKQKQNEQLSRLLVGFFVLIVLLHAVESVIQWLPEPYKHYLEFFEAPIFKAALLGLSLIVPAAIAKVEATKFFKEWEKFEMQSEAMIGYFKTQKAALENGAAPDEILDRVDQDMFNENMDWQMLMMDKGHLSVG